MVLRAELLLVAPGPATPALLGVNMPVLSPTTDRLHQELRGWRPAICAPGRPPDDPRAPSTLIGAFWNEGETALDWGSVREE